MPKAAPTAPRGSATSNSKLLQLGGVGSRLRNADVGPFLRLAVISIEGSLRASAAVRGQGQATQATPARHGAGGDLTIGHLNAAQTGRASDRRGRIEISGVEFC